MSVIEKGYDCAPSHTGSSRPGAPAATNTHWLSLIHWLSHLNSGFSPLDSGLGKSSELLLQQKVLDNDHGHLVQGVN
jgi:hypothetical protein